MESMAIDILLLFLAAAGMMVAFIKNRESVSAPLQAGDSKEIDKREE